MDDELATYRVELQQVQAALAADPTNAELLDLESNLNEVIQLSTQFTAPKQASAAATSSGGWSVGDTCEAIWASDGGYYKAVIESVTDEKCSVKFVEYGDVDTVQTSSLRKLATAPKRKAGESVAVGGTVVEQKTEAEKEVEREYKRKKREKKKERLAEKDKEATGQANSWQKFNKGRSKRSKTGFLSGKQKDSIFRSPDGVTGKVGVGTNGMGGKGMTDFTKRDKWTFDKD